MLRRWDLESLRKVALRGGFEPPTPWFVAKYSIQLSYRSAEEVTYSSASGKATPEFRKLLRFVNAPGDGAGERAGGEFTDPGEREWLRSGKLLLRG